MAAATAGMSHDDATDVFEFVSLMSSIPVFVKRYDFMVGFATTLVNDCHIVDNFTPTYGSEEVRAAAHAIAPTALLNT